MNFNADGGITVEEPHMMYCFPVTSTSSSLSSNDEMFAYSGDEGPPGPQSPKIIIRTCGEFDFVRQACKARGIKLMPGQNPHVARFAYIDIPVGTKCGTVLSCSHPVCLSSGRRFRYCTHCKTAVAKRNFNVRHAHANLRTTPTTISTSRLKATKYYDLASEFSVDMSSHHFEDTDVPTIISLNDHSKTTTSARSPVDKAPSIHMPLSAREAELINLLRSRPRHDCPSSLKQWKTTLLSLSEKRPTTPSKKKYSPTEEQEDTPYSTPHADSSDSVSVSSFDIVGFESLDFPDLPLSW